MPWSLFLNKWFLGSVAALLLAWGVHAGVSSVQTAYRERANLTLQVRDLQNGLLAARKQDAAEIAKANKTADDLKAEVKLRDDLAIAAAKRQQQTEKDLRNAQSKIKTWRDQADANLTACLNTDLPAGMFGQPAETRPAPAGGAH